MMANGTPAEAWYCLAQLPSMTLHDLVCLARAFPTGTAAWEASADDWVRSGIPSDRVTRLREEQRNGVAVPPDQSWISIDDAAYPALLRHSSTPPVVLYIRGAALPPTARALAVVGTRRPSAYGRLMVRTLVPPLVEAGYVIVSGLAYGIDADVHQATLDAGGTTWAVLGSGIDQAGPLQNVGLAHRIIEHGGTLVSEYRAGTEAQAYHFPIRNRIIAGLTLATLVIEAPARSGALITAREALDENREVFAVPHDTTRPSGVGTNALLRAGAHLVASPEDILTVLEPDRPVQTASQPMALANPLEQTLVDILRRGPQSIDQCVAASGADSSTVTTSLSMLELRGVVRHLGGQTFALVGQRRPMKSKEQI